MSEQLPPLVSHESLRIITAAAQVGEVSADVLAFLSASVEYHLLDVLNDASNYRSRGKRSRLTVEDVNASLKFRGAESSVVFSSGVAGLKDDGSSDGTVVGADTKVDLRKVANASLPVCPIEAGFGMHWLAVDGQQPLLPQNPIPSNARGKSGKGGKRGRAAGEGGDEGKGSSSVQARLSEELTTYLRRCCEAVLSRDEAKRGRAMSSLRNDPGLQQLLPHLCTFIHTKVVEHLKSKKDPNQLAALLQMLQCLLNNPHFAFLEIYLDRLLPSLVSCMLYSDFERREGRSSSPSQSSSSSSSPSSPSSPSPSSSLSSLSNAVPALPSSWTHWKVRDYAAEILRAIRDKHGPTYPTLQAQAVEFISRQMKHSKSPLNTLYGAIKGLACLGPLPVDQVVSPKVDSLVDRISKARAVSIEKQDARGVAQANQCLLALLQAAGLVRVGYTRHLFGKGKTIAKLAPNKASPLVAISSEANTNKGAMADNGNSAAGAGAGAGRIAHNRRLQTQLRRRLDRSLYPSLGSNTGGGGTKQKNGPAGANGPARASTGPSATMTRGLVMAEGRDGDDGTATGLGALDEVLIPWLVLGLKRDAAQQSKWLISRNSLFV